ncbi:MAG: right-handed parallel beta-helix repeat-containing protein, partial [Thermoplasmata archaeon]|nr:right-handed parallel beta-helix repeat-containing protein [Thermoplasmata archaeon]
MLAQGDTGRMTHDPIQISGNSELDAIFAGAGSDGLTPATAHILEEVIIDNDRGRGNCVFIGNTTRYLIIRNCTIYDGAPTSDAIAVQLKIVSNVSLVDCEFPGTWKAVLVSDSSNVLISGNRIANQSTKGIHVEGTEHATIVGNEVDTSIDSVVVDKSDNITVDGNRVTESKMGILVSSSRDFVVVRNKVSFSSMTGIRVVGSGGNNVVELNDVQHNLFAGIQVASSSGVVVVANHVEANYQGIHLGGAEECIITNNDVMRNDQVGIRLANSENNRVEDNEVKSNWNYGIDVIESTTNEITG